MWGVIKNTRSVMNIGLIVVSMLYCFYVLGNLL